MIARSQIERMQQESAEAGDMVAVAVCQIALGYEVTAAMSEHEAYRLEQLDLRCDEAGSGGRARAVIQGWLADAVAEVQS